MKCRNKKISAQDQVNNKVNSGILDTITNNSMGENKDLSFKSHTKSNGIEELLPKNKKSFNYLPYLKSIASYFSKVCGLNIKPFPKVIIKNDNQNGLFIKTGYYNPTKHEIVLFSNERHPKDILRSFAHELIHHAQNLRGDSMLFYSNDEVRNNKELEKLEAEAYLFGNIYFRKWTEQFNNASNLNESQSIKIDSQDKKYLGSFQIKNYLNPKFWNNNELNKQIRLKLLDIADDFIKDTGITQVKPSDIIITGSLANYNWNRKYSDIDLHILYDFKKIDKNIDLIKKYFDAKKKIWNEQHGKISILGFPVEIYVQDINEPHFSSGIYSLQKEKWIIEPDKEKMKHALLLLIGDKRKGIIKSKISSYIERIDKCINSFNEIEKNKNIFLYKKLYKEISDILSSIKKERKKSLNKEIPEYSNGNIIFKSLRRLNYIAKAIKLKNKIYNIIQSVS